MNKRITSACAIAMLFGLVAPAAVVNAQAVKDTADTEINLTVQPNSAGSLRFSIAPQKSATLFVNFGGTEANSAMVAVVPHKVV